MSLMNALFGGDLGDSIEDGKKAQLEQSRTFQMGIDDLREAEIGDKVIFSVLEPYKTSFIEGECSVVEIDGKKLLEEIK